MVRESDPRGQAQTHARHPQRLEEQQPFLAGQDDAGQPESATTEHPPLDVYHSHALNHLDVRVWLAQSAIVAFVGLIWYMIFSAFPYSPFDLPPFALHPLLQSFTFFVLIQSILTLQSTSLKKAGEKRAAFDIHRFLNLFVSVPLFSLGAFIMWYLHHQPNAKHFISWHGICGTVVVVWVWIQTIIGIVITWSQSVQLLFLDEEQAKRLYKWHRVSGYALAVLFLVTLYLGATQTAWAKQTTSQTFRLLILSSLATLAIALFARVRTGKLPRPVSSGDDS